MGEINLDDYKPRAKKPLDENRINEIFRQAKPMMSESAAPKFDSSGDRAMHELDKKVSQLRQEAESLLKIGKTNEAQRKIKEAHDLYERGKREIVG